MNDDRFDALLRAVAATPSRRRAVLLLAGATLGGLLTLGALPTDARKGGNGKRRAKRHKRHKRANKTRNRNDRQENAQTPTDTEPVDEDGVSIQAKPICPADFSTVNCPTCHEAKYGADGAGDGGCCDPTGRPRDCSDCTQENTDFCGSAINEGLGSCVTAVCRDIAENGPRCAFEKIAGHCTDPNSGFCCRHYRSTLFGHCVTDKDACLAAVPVA